MLSVIITTFEQTESLTALLYCLKAQDVSEDFEILICDDGSVEGALPNIVSESRLSDLDIRYIWQTKMGHRAARSKNNALRCARGDITVFLDGDILVGPDFLRKHRMLHSTKRMIVCNPRKWIMTKKLSLRSTAISDLKTYGVITMLTQAAKDNLFNMVELLEKISVHVEASGQRALAQSPSPWMACLGFSFSVDTSSVKCYFDEYFQGWGPEDREFAVRLVRNHNYTVQFSDDIVVYHLEECSTGRTPFVPLPRDHGQIITYFRNMLYFFHLYPEENLFHIMRSLLAYDFDAQNDTWNLCPQRMEKQHSEDEIVQQIKRIEHWMQERFHGRIH